MTVLEVLREARSLYSRLRLFRPVSQDGKCIFCWSLIAGGPPDYGTVGKHLDNCEFVRILKLLEELTTDE